MDFSKLNETEICNRAVCFDNVKGPDGKVLDGVKFYLKGSGSEAAQAKSSLYQKMTLGQINNLTVQEQYDMTTNKLIACTNSWEGIDMEGKLFPFNESNARFLYSNKGFTWLRLQIISFVDDSSIFFQNANES